MTEEQRKQCKEIINSCCKNSFLLCCPDIMRITISLAKIFDKEITEKEAKEIFNKFYEDISSFQPNNYFSTFWRIANYFYDGKTYGFIPNYLRDKNFKEIKKDNENNKENNK